MRFDRGAINLGVSISLSALGITVSPIGFYSEVESCSSFLFCFVVRLFLVQCHLVIHMHREGGSVNLFVYIYIYMYV